MNIRTQSGIKIYCLPSSALCKCTRKSPEHMNECPICNFDYFGMECVPELCDKYEENETSVEE